MSLWRSLAVLLPSGLGLPQVPNRFFGLPQCLFGNLVLAPKIFLQEIQIGRWHRHSLPDHLSSNLAYPSGFDIRYHGRVPGGCALSISADANRLDGVGKKSPARAGRDGHDRRGALNLSRPAMPTADGGVRFAQGSYSCAAQHCAAASIWSDWSNVNSWRVSSGSLALNEAVIGVPMRRRRDGLIAGDFS